ncbi:hypothetical protein HC891_08675 [Candidatus Gracilibacteria bacterium]|nr:hypothetical protein [Candidatus Gracilibacteria bacterium]
MEREVEDRGTIIFLNGTSSAGKTSIAHAFQEKSDAPYIHLSIDQFVYAVPARFWAGDTIGTVHPYFTTLVSGYHHCIAALALRGDNVLVDHVLQEDKWWYECAHILAPLHAVLVTVYCPLRELERREAARGDRPIGLARFQYPRVYGNGLYDIKVNTSVEDSDACAGKIQEFIRSKPQVSAFTSIIQANTTTSLVRLSAAKGLGGDASLRSTGQGRVKGDPLASEAVRITDHRSRITDHESRFTDHNDHSESGILNPEFSTIERSLCDITRHGCGHSPGGGAGTSGPRGAVYADAGRTAERRPCAAGGCARHGEDADGQDAGPVDGGRI